MLYTLSLSLSVSALPKSVYCNIWGWEVLLHFLFGKQLNTEMGLLRAWGSGF